MPQDHQNQLSSSSVDQEYTQNMSWQSSWSYLLYNLTLMQMNRDLQWSRSQSFVYLSTKLTVRFVVSMTERVPV